MADQTILEGDGENTSSTQLPADIKEWTKEDVQQWIRESNVDEKYADILFKQEVNGTSFLLCNESDFKSQGIPLGPTKLIISKRDELVKLKASQEKFVGQCSPYPFNRYHQGQRYRESSTLAITETGPLNLIEPCHEFKAFIHLMTKDEQIEKFISKVIPFGAACMNSRTNGTIHFGIGDRPKFGHGEILGFKPCNKEDFLKYLQIAIMKMFEEEHVDAANKCFKTPRFVEVLHPDMTFSNKYVLEVDIKPDSSICKKNIYKIKKGPNVNGEEEYFLYIRDNTSTKNLLANVHKEYLKKYCDDISLLSGKREQAEANRLDSLKKSVQGFKLCEMLTGGTKSLDKSNYQEYILVTNKSHPVQLEYLNFLCEMKLTAILDFDPESVENGLKTVFENENTNVHSLTQYEIKDSALDIASKLRLTRATSWVFCNGTINQEETERPSEADSWSIEKGAAVREVVSYLCRKDVLPPKKFLVIFMLFSDVSDSKDPLLKTLDMFHEKLQGFEQILCICENEHIFKNWIQLTGNSNIASRCIYELSFAEINGTILSLWSKKCRSSRFLPGGGGSKVEITKKMESRLDTLEILCVNQCQDEELDEKTKASIEDAFYRGGKVTWWNFQICEEPNSSSFIKRDRFYDIINTIIPDIRSSSNTCVVFNIMHLPGCGGTTLAMHILWELKKEFRCAVLTDGMIDHSEVAKQVMELLSHGTATEQPPLSVLLMIDNFDDMDDIHNLKQTIESEYLKSDLGTRKPQIIILNCMRKESLERTESTEDTVFLGNKLSNEEQKQFGRKLAEFEKSNKNVETFYGFMIMKQDFSSDYIKKVTKNILKNFDFNDKVAEVFAVLILLDFYCKKASISVALCEELCDLHKDQTVEDGFGKLFQFVTVFEDKGSVVFKAVRMINSRLAEHCLNEINSAELKRRVSKADITLHLLTNDMYFECIQGTDKLRRTIHNMLVKRNYAAGADKTQFSPLIHTIDEEARSTVETVLLKAVERFPKDAVIFQLLARYYYREKKDFGKARKWAKKAKDFEPNNSFYADTYAQVMKSELSNKINEYACIEPEQLRECLKMAERATGAFRETQALAGSEARLRFKKNDCTTYNTAGHLGEVQVAVQVLKVLQQTPVFSKNQNKLCDFLSLKVNLRAIVSSDTMGHNTILQQFEGLLQTLKENMKTQFIFFESFFVILEKRFDQQDSKKQGIGNKVSECFDSYAKLFCQPHTVGDGNMLRTLNIRQSLEMDKADTHNGLLNHLSNLNEVVKIENIFKNYASIYKQGRCSTLDKAHLIYANIVLNCLKPTSNLKYSYRDLSHVLRQILEVKGPFTPNESLAVHFLAVMMLWPDKNSLNIEKNCEKYDSYLTQLKDGFDKQMIPVNNGMWPAVHFFLGNKQGYGRFVSRKDINKCLGPEHTASIWKNGWIRKHKEVKKQLLEVTGKVSRNCVLADTTHPNVKIPVSPLSRCELKGRVGYSVTFYVGFSMKGPVAFDIENCRY